MSFMLTGAWCIQFGHFIMQALVILKSVFVHFVRIVSKDKYQSIILM